MKKRTYFVLCAGIGIAGYIGVTYYLNVYHSRSGNQNIPTYEGQDLRNDTPTIVQELIDKDPEAARINKEYQERTALKKRSSQIKVKKLEEKVLDN